VLYASPAFAQTVVDGDTLKLNGTTYRLWGIDAAETHQSCADGWPAGVLAANALGTMVRGRGRTVAICRADGADLSVEMVRAGHALAFTRYSSDYVQQEAQAKAAKVGVHAHDCIAAWEWRAQHR
jgi:endonuclease YncB( thermonuclease family)